MKDEKDKQETANEGNNKIEKKYNTNFRKFVALLGGEKNLKKVSVPSDGIGEVVESLLKERREEHIKTFKEKAKALLDKKLLFDKEVKAAEEALKKTVLEKKDAFNKEMEALFALVSGLEEVEKSYYTNLGGKDDTAAPATETPAE